MHRHLCNHGDNAGHAVKRNIGDKNNTKTMMTTISIGMTMPTATSTASNGGNLDHDMNDRQCRGVNVGHEQRTSVLPLRERTSTSPRRNVGDGDDANDDGHIHQPRCVHDDGVMKNVSTATSETGTTMTTITTMMDMTVRVVTTYGPRDQRQRRS